MYEARKYLRQQCHALVAHVTEKKQKEFKISDIPITCGFPEVFPDDLPGLPPALQVEFRIDLIPCDTPRNPTAGVLSR
jgi:hypothetical protein